MEHKHSYKTEVKKISGSRVEIKSEIPADEFSAHVADTLAEAVRDAELPGFRKGTAPEKLVKEKIGVEALLHDAAREAISHAYMHIVESEKIDAIGRPEISITKIAENNPLAFTLVTAVVPEIKDFDYKSAAAKENKKEIVKVKVTDKDVDEMVKNILKNYSESAKLEKPAELSDELVKKFGEFSSVEDFKKKLKENMTAEKEQRETEKRRVALIEALVAGVSVEVPEILIDKEIERMISEMKNDVSRMGFSWADYLKQMKKTEEDLKKDWRKPAEKRVILDLAIDHIAKVEKISADEKKVADELKHIQEHHKEIDVENAKSYLTQVYQNQAVFEFLEKQK